MRRAAVVFTAATAISFVMVNGAAALESDPLTVPESFAMSVYSSDVSATGGMSSDGNLTTSQRTRELGLDFMVRDWREAGLSEHLMRSGRLRPDRFTVIATNTHLSPALGLTGTSVKQVVRNALKMRFVWNWERGETTIQFTKGSLQVAGEVTGLVDAPVYRDDVVRLRQTWRFGAWRARGGLALGRFEGDNDTAAWREDTVTARFGVAGRLHRMPVETDLTVRHRMRDYADGAGRENTTAWKLTGNLNLSDYLWRPAPGRKPWLSVNFGAFGNDPDAVGADSYGSGIDYQVGFRAGQRF